VLAGLLGQVFGGKPPRLSQQVSWLISNFVNLIVLIQLMNFGDGGMAAGVCWLACWARCLAASHPASPSR
jgi:hypothetical protein